MPPEATTTPEASQPVAEDYLCYVPLTSTTVQGYNDPMACYLLAFQEVHLRKNRELNEKITDMQNRFASFKTDLGLAPLAPVETQPQGLPAHTVVFFSMLLIAMFIAGFVIGYAKMKKETAKN